jgi:hypothetical protein
MAALAKRVAALLRETIYVMFLDLSVSEQARAAAAGLPLVAPKAWGEW